MHLPKPSFSASRSRSLPAHTQTHIHGSDTLQSISKASPNRPELKRSNNYAPMKTILLMRVSAKFIIFNTKFLVFEHKIPRFLNTKIQIYSPSASHSLCAGPKLIDS